MSQSGGNAMHGMEKTIVLWKVRLFIVSKFIAN
jgi:hypothetical protein